MNRRILTALAVVTAVGFFGAGFGATQAAAEERLISNRGYERDYQGGGWIDVLQELQIGGMRGEIRSVIVIASSRVGRGVLEIAHNGRLLFQKQVGTSFEAIQVPVNREIWPGTKHLTVHLRGNFTVAQVSAVVDDRLGHQPGQPGGPGYPGPGHPGNPGYPGPNVVSDSEFAALLGAVSQEAFDDKKIVILNQYLDHWRGRLLVMKHLGGFLDRLTFDDNKLEALRIIRPILVVETRDIEGIVSKFTFQSNREQARRILLSR